MTKIWYCPNCGYEVDRGGRCHSCRESLVASPLPELDAGEPDDEVGYRLDDWEDSLRGELIDRLIDAGILHRFEEDELIVGVADEKATDELVADVTGRSGSGDVGDGVGSDIDPDDLRVLNELLSAAQRLQADPTDMNADADVGEASALLFLIDDIPGTDPDTWAAIGRVTRRLLGALSAEEALEHEIANQAAILARLLEPVIAGAGSGGDIGSGATVPVPSAAAGVTSGEEETPAEKDGGGSEARSDVVVVAPTAPVAPAAPVPMPALSHPDPESSGTDAFAETDTDRESDSDVRPPADASLGSDTGVAAAAEAGDELVYEMTGWLPEQRAELALHLEHAGIAVAWEGDDLIVPATREAEVDALFEQIEEGGEDDVDDEERYHALEDLFGAADRLAHDPDDDDRRQEVLDAVEGIADAPMPIGLDDAKWWQITTRARTLADAVSADAPKEQVRRHATVLRDLLREIV